MRTSTGWGQATLLATRDLAPDIREFTLRPQGAMPLAYPPGAHLKFRLTINGEIAIRHYSLIGIPDGATWRIAVRRAPEGHGGSLAMWRLAVGDVVEVAPPESHFDLAIGAPEVLLVAGGIGVTPLIYMAESLARRGAKMRMLYAGRNRGALAYLEHLDALLGARLDIRAEDEHGRVDLAAEFATLHPQAEAYVCGPIGMLEAARNAWAAAGRPATALRYETFGAATKYPAEPFMVHIPNLGRDILVPAERSMLEALEAAGVEMLADCKRGECGLCTVEVLAVEGRLDHGDIFLSDAEKEEGTRMCTCVSRAIGGDITIDVGWRAAEAA